MEIIKILYKIVNEPRSLTNYEELRKYFNQNKLLEYEEAIAHLIKTKNVATNSPDS